MSNHQQIFASLGDVPTQLFINNQWQDAQDKGTFAVTDPSNEHILCQVASARSNDIDLAVRAARLAFESGDWSKMDPTMRSSLLFKLANIIEENQEVLSKLEALDNGKFDAGLYDIPVAANVVRYYAGWCDKLPVGEIIPSDVEHSVWVMREPIGVVGVIVPWNYPFLITIWKVAPALAVGCTVVIKPSEVTPLTALYLGKLVQQVGFPPGVINIVPGLGAVAGAGISSHMDIDKVTFTGSTETGRRVMVAAAQSNLKQVSLELGGKSPNVVFDDCHFEEAVVGACQALFVNMGQNCCSGSRLYVQDGIHDEFVEALVKLVESIHVGDPLSMDSQLASQIGKMVHGPLVDRNQLDKVLYYIEKAKREGAVLVTGGYQIGSEGFYVKPTVFVNVGQEFCIAREEVFGPVLVVLRFKDLEDVISKVNDSHYGLAAAIWSSDKKKINAFNSRIKSGYVWNNTYNIVKYNAPFGGVKETGFGRDLGRDALMEYMNVKTLVSRM